MYLNRRFVLASVVLILALLCSILEIGSVRSVFAGASPSKSDVGMPYRHAERGTPEDFSDQLKLTQAWRRAVARSMPIRVASNTGASPLGFAPPLTLVVNRNDDITPRGTGSTCITPASTDCTLREAIIKANANAGSTINFAATTNSSPITLSQVNAGGVNEDASLTGDLDVNASVTIQGHGAA